MASLDGWSEWTYGMDENFLGYYWFAVDLVNDTCASDGHTTMCS